MVPRDRPLALAVALLVALGAAASGGLVVASHGSDFHITTPSTIDIPDRTVEVDGTEYTVTAISKVRQNGTLSVSVDAATAISYLVRVYNTDNQHVKENGCFSGDADTSFDIEQLGLDPSIYYLAIVECDGGSIRNIHPFVVKGYDVSATVPGSAESDETITVTAELTDRSGLAISSVEVVLANGGESYTQTMAGSDGSYSADVSMDSLSTGTYRVYVVVRGEEEANGEKVPIGLSDAHELEVTAASTPTPTPTATESSGSTGGGGGGGAVGGGGGDPTSTPTPTATPVTSTATATPAETTPSTTTATPGSSPTDAASPAAPTTTTDGGTTPPTTAAATAPATTDNVVTPIPVTTASTATDPGTDTSSPGQPGFTALTALAGLLVLGWRRARR